MSDKRKVQGEGDYDAARRYRKDVEDFAQKGDVKGAAQEAKKAREGKERDALERAEQAAKDKAKARDPKAGKD